MSSLSSQFTTDNHKLPDTPPCNTGLVLSSINFSPTLMKRVISKLNERSAGGPDNIPPVFFKNACSSVCHHLAFIFQWLFDDGYTFRQYVEKPSLPQFVKKVIAPFLLIYRPIFIDMYSM